MSETSPWTDEAKAYLDELLQHQPPLNYDAIADRMVSKFHRVFTKNSCISRARRNGPKKERAKNKPREPKIYRHPVAEKPRPKVVTGKVTIDQLDNHTCRWPVTDGLPPYLYCGLVPLDGLPYCAEHCRKGYTSGGR
jgi:hypothetical protein